MWGVRERKQGWRTRKWRCYLIRSGHLRWSRFQGWPWVSGLAYDWFELLFRHSGRGAVQSENTFGSYEHLGDATWNHLEVWMDGEGQDPGLRGERDETVVREMRGNQRACSSVSQVRTCHKVVETSSVKYYCQACLTSPWSVIVNWYCSL